jgi:hypothetical protein
VVRIFGIFIVRELIILGFYPGVLGADAYGRTVWVFCVKLSPPNHGIVDPICVD